MEIKQTQNIGKFIIEPHTLNFIIFHSRAINVFLLSSSRFTSAAQDLVMHSRGKPEGHNWQTSGGAPGTIDDISVFVIPLLQYKEDWDAWKKVNDELRQKKNLNSQSPGMPAQTKEASLDRQPIARQPSAKEDQLLESGEGTAISHQNGLAQIEVLVPHSEVLDVSELPLADISLDAVEVMAPEDGIVSNGANGIENGDNTDPNSSNYCER